MISEISRGYEFNETRGGSPRLKAFSTSLPFSLQFSKSLNWNSFNFLFNFLLKTPPGIATSRWLVDWEMTVRGIILLLTHSVCHLIALLWHDWNSWTMKWLKQIHCFVWNWRLWYSYELHKIYCIYKHLVPVKYSETAENYSERLRFPWCEANITKKIKITKHLQSQIRETSCVNLKSHYYIQEHRLLYYKSAMLIIQP